MQPPPSPPPRLPIPPSSPQAFGQRFPKDAPPEMRGGSGLEWGEDTPPPPPPPHNPKSGVWGSWGALRARCPAWAAANCLLRSGAFFKRGEIRGGKKKKRGEKKQKKLPPNVSKSNKSVSSQGRSWGMGCAGLGWATLRPSVLRGALVSRVGLQGMSGRGGVSPPACGCGDALSVWDTPCGCWGRRRRFRRPDVEL